LQFYREPRIAKVDNIKGWPTYFEYFIEEVPATPDTPPGPDGSPGAPGQPGGYVMNKRDLQVDPQSGQVQAQNDWQKSAPTEGLFDLKVTAGSSLPFMKAQRSELAFKLLEVGAIDNHEVLEAVDWPNLEEVEQRMEKAAASAPPKQDPPRISYSANAADPNAAAILQGAGIKAQQGPPPMPVQPQGAPV
jgi:hypothetical protein